MFGCQEKITRHTKRQKTQFEASESKHRMADMAGMLEQPDQEFKTTMINRALMKNWQHTSVRCD